MTTFTNLTNQMNTLEQEISRQQNYILTHGENNDKGEYDAQWEQYKEEAKYNVNKWESMKAMRNNLK